MKIKCIWKKIVKVRKQSVILPVAGCFFKIPIFKNKLRNIQTHYIPNMKKKILVKPEGPLLRVFLIMCTVYHLVKSYHQKTTESAK